MWGGGSTPGVQGGWLVGWDVEQSEGGPGRGKNLDCKINQSINQSISQSVNQKVKD